MTSLPLTLLFVFANADLPVHCLRHQITGDWTFHLSEPTSERTKCGHQSPDAAGSQPSVGMNDYPTKVNVNLEGTSSASSDGEMGSWTMVYDEGFEVKVGMKTFFAFNQFDGSIEADGNIQNYQSNCKQTEVGWYSDEAMGKYGCFVGVKGDGAGPAPAKSGSSLLRTEDIYEPRKTPEEELDAILSKESFLQEHEVVSLEKHMAHVQKINNANKGWTAKVYSHLLNKTHAELNQMSGIRRAGVKSSREPRQHTFLQMETRRSRTMIDSLPKDFDWRNKDGENFLGAPVNQGSCGSCYVISTVNMMSSRKRILDGNPHGEGFSYQFPLFCGEYNQGCNGGYPELVAKWSHDITLLPESCGSYDLGDQSCKVTCDVGSVDQYRVSEYGYVGGYYGASTEANMMQEVYENGPIAIAIEPNDDFMYYEQGVYEHASALFDEWTKVDHAVLLTGWGEDSGKKYWRVQNSWGPQWGEQGTFRIRRGVDESAVEAQPVYAKVQKSNDGATNAMLYTR
jgi:cathepsin C